MTAVTRAPAVPGPDLTPPKPSFRGRIHQIAAIVSGPSAIALVLIAPAGAARIASIVYAMTLVNMFVTSGLYHRLAWTARGMDRMMRLDHCAIYLLIAGSYTPFTVLALDGWARTVMLATVWGGASTMIVLKALRLYGLRVLFGAMYIVLGWAAVLAFPAFVRELPIASMILMAAGGVLYTAGAVVLMRRRPDPRPLVFGYHEVWHVFMTTAAACHYAAIVILLLSRR